MSRLVRRLCRSVIYLLALGMALELVLLFTPVPEYLLAWLDVTEPARKADAILCLGGADRRQIWSAELFHKGFAPLVVVSNAPVVAEAMRDQVVMAGVPTDKVLVDNSSFCTADHPAGIAALPGINPETQTFLIVTRQEHSRRTQACFHRAGFRNVIIYSGLPTSDILAPNKPYSWKHWFFHLPYVAYEYAALAKYWWQDKI